MGLFKKIFGDDDETEREEAAKRKAAEEYAEQHSRESGHAHEHAGPAKKAATAKAAPARSEPVAKKPAPAKTAATAKPVVAKKTTAKVAAVTAKKATAKAAPAKPAAAEKHGLFHGHGHDPVPPQRTYAPLTGAPAADAHTHVHEVAEGPVTAAHDQMMTIHVETHVPDHAPREDDPHYHLFEQAKARLKRQGLWKCIIADELCGGEPELHHTYIEFSQINEVDPKRVEEALGLHFDSDEAFQQWAESPGNLEVLCANHHRTHYGIHVIPGPLWEALRFRMVGTEAAAEFVTADEAKDETKDEAKEAAK
ncbi:MAG TPA: hypothetical protein VH372_00785 [Actinospica sp.]|nr:hypothetical protein [Actinospica sp.]